MPTSPGTDDRTDTGSAADPGRSAEQRGPDEQIADLRDQLARCTERELRARADLDNYRKRTERDAARRLAAARQAVLLDWLPAVDSVERALRIQPDDPGLIAVREQMRAILSRYGVVDIDAVGARFDPRLHEALATRPALDEPGHTVLEVVRSGFALADGAVLRPAQVVVSRRPEGEF